MDQLAEYRARQQLRFEAQQLEQQLLHEGSGTVQEDKADADNAGRRRQHRPPVLSLRDEAFATAPCCSCPGTPREYRERHQQRFAAEKNERQQEQEAAGVWGRLDTEQRAPLRQTDTELPSPGCITNSSPPTPNSSSCNSSPPTPRLRGSASLRAISAARAMRAADAAPLPGAAWPGHCHDASRSKLPNRKPPVLPSPPSAPSSISPALHRSRSRASSALPPRPSTPSLAQGYAVERTWTSCAQAVHALARSDSSTSMSILCH